MVYAIGRSNVKPLIFQFNRRLSQVKYSPPRVGAFALLCVFFLQTATAAQPNSNQDNNGQSNSNQPRSYPPHRLQEVWFYTFQEARVLGSVSDAEMPFGVDPGTLIRRSVTVAFEIDENGHAAHLHVTKSSGSVDVDDACEVAIHRTRFVPAINDHLKLSSPATITFHLE